MISKHYKAYFSIYIGFFSSEAEYATISIQLELIDSQNDLVLKGKYGKVRIHKIYSFFLGGGEKIVLNERIQNFKTIRKKQNLAIESLFFLN